MKKKYLYGLPVLTLAVGLSLVFITQNSREKGGSPISNMISNITNIDISNDRQFLKTNTSSVEAYALDDADKRQLIHDYYDLNDTPDLSSKEYREQYAKISGVLENGISNFDSVEELNVELDNMLLTDELTRSQKAFLLWGLIEKEIEKSELDYTAIEMLTDSAHFLNPIEVAEMVIAEIDSGRHDLHVNNELIKLLGVSHYLYQDLKVGQLFQENPSSANIIVENGERIIEYFDILLLTPPSKEVLPQVVEIYPRIASAEKHDLLISVLNQDTDLFSDDKYLDARLQLALSNSDKSELGLSNLVEFVSESNYSEEVLSNFNDKFIRQAANQLLSDEALTEDSKSEEVFFSDASRYVMERYITTQNSEYPVSTFMDEPVISTIQFRDQFLMTSLLKTNTKRERVNYTLDYIMEAPPHHRLALVVGLSDDDDFLNEFQENDNLKLMLKEDFSGRNNSEGVNYVFSHFEDLDVIKGLLKPN